MDELTKVREKIERLASEVRRCRGLREQADHLHQSSAKARRQSRDLFVDASIFGMRARATADLTRSLLRSSESEEHTAARYLVLREFTMNGEWEVYQYEPGDVIAPETVPESWKLPEFELLGLVAKGDYHLGDLVGPGNPWDDVRWMG